MSIKDYAEIKTRLKTETSETLKYFTKQFLTVYIAALETIKRNQEKGVDDGYWDGIIWTHHAWDDVRKTDFYIKTSCAYCSFLFIALDYCK